MQRRNAAHRAVRIGPLFQQKQRELVLSVEDGQRQRMRAVGPGIVRARARGKEDLRHLDVAIARGKQQWREAFVRRGMNVGTGLKQHPDDMRMGRCHGPHQCGGSGAGRDRIHGGAVRQQRLHHLKVAGPRCNHQRRQAAGLRSIRLGSRRQQSLDNIDACVLACARQRRDTMVVGGIHVGARVEKQLHRATIVPVRCPQQRRGPVRARRVDVHTVMQQRADRLPILLRRGIHESEIGTSGRRPGGPREQDHHRQNAEPYHSREHHTPSRESAVNIANRSLRPSHSWFAGSLVASVLVQTSVGPRVADYSRPIAGKVCTCFGAQDGQIQDRCASTNLRPKDRRMILRELAARPFSGRPE